MATQSSWADRVRILCSLPVAVLATIAALDSADKALLGASFPMLGELLLGAIRYQSGDPYT